MVQPQLILEIASTHGGNLEYIYEIIENSKHLGKCGIKFQIFKPELLADEKYEGYKTYQRLYYDNSQWRKIIKRAYAYKLVWVDVFDDYSIDVIKNNIELIEGIKLQSSIIENPHIINKILDLNKLKKLKFIINVSGFEIEDITNVLTKIEEIKSKQIYLQVGFQSHPTLFENSVLNKLLIIKTHFSNYKLSFTDHLSTNSNDALTLPLIASTLGAEIIEKHVFLENRETKYDFYSSISLSLAKDLYDKMKSYHFLLNKKEFICQAENDYLNKSYVYPQINSSKKKGSQISIKDLRFKRNLDRGLKISEFENLIKDHYLLSIDIVEGEVLKKNHFKKANIGGVIICRMKSSRLKNKALLNVGDLSSIEYCIKNILEFDNIHKVILATSDHKDDSILKKHTYNKDVEFFKGDPEDVIKRLLDVAEKYKLDVIVRITGDSPLRSNKLYNKLLNSHFETGADYTAANDVPVGMNIEIINVLALKRLFSLFNKSTPYSEYLSYYFRNNPDYFKLNLVSFNLSIKSNIRLTIDYKEDLELINVIEKEFNFCENKFDVEKVVDFLEKNEAINKINSHCQKTYSENSNLLKEININTKLNL